jgi:hypothetical protein
MSKHDEDMGSIILKPLEADGRGGSWCRVLLLVLSVVLCTKFFLCVQHVLFGVLYDTK